MDRQYTMTNLNHAAPECAEGWKVLYEPIYKLADLFGVRVEQVKEKFGYLRVYTWPHKEEFQELIYKLENISCYICEYCGVAHEEGIKGTWMQSLCKDCREKREASK